MDGKKQNLNPELKAIYDRVMNTQVKPAGLPPAQPPTPSPVSPMAAAPLPQIPVIPSIHPAGTVGATPVSPHPTASPVPGPSLNPKPLNSMGGDQPFVFTSNHKTPSGAHAGSGKKFPMPLVAGGILIFIIVYAIGWMKFFKIF